MNIRNVLPKDVIPSIDDPEFDSSYFGAATDEVVDGDLIHAYPIRILNYHEILNHRWVSLGVIVTAGDADLYAFEYPGHDLRGRPTTAGR